MVLFSNTVSSDLTIKNTPALESAGSLSEAASLAEMVERMVVEQAVRLLLTMMLMQAA